MNWKPHGYIVVAACLIVVAGCGSQARQSPQSSDVATGVVRLRGDCDSVVKLRTVLDYEDSIPTAGHATLVGTLHNVLSGNPPSHGFVSVVDAAGTATIRAASTDSTGWFRIDSIPAGMRQVRVESIGFSTQVHHMEFVPKTTEILCAGLLQRPLLLVPVRAGGS